MTASYPNIEKHPTHHGRYIGYREGRVYCIQRGGVRGSLWVAAEVQAGRITGAPFIFAATLGKLSQALAEGPTATHY